MTVTSVEAILLNGGTGIAMRDTTYEAVRDVLDKEKPNRSAGSRYGEYGLSAAHARDGSVKYRGRPDIFCVAQITEYFSESLHIFLEQFADGSYSIISLS